MGKLKKLKKRLHPYKIYYEEKTGKFYILKDNKKKYINDNIIK